MAHNIPSYDVTKDSAKTDFLLNLSVQGFRVIRPSQGFTKMMEVPTCENNVVVERAFLPFNDYFGLSNFIQKGAPNHEIPK